MLITAAALAVVLAIALPPLRSRWYLLYATLLLATSYGLEHSYFPEGYITNPFSHRALGYILLLHILVINITTMCAYIYDKRAATLGLWRVPERTLLAFAFIGGTPAAALTCKLIRHKTRKNPFRAQFWIITLAQIFLIFFIANRLAPHL